MIRHRNRHRAVGIGPLHRDMAAASSDFDEATGGENSADVASRQDAQPSQPRPLDFAA